MVLVYFLFHCAIFFIKQKTKKMKHFNKIIRCLPVVVVFFIFLLFCERCWFIEAFHSSKHVVLLVYLRGLSCDVCLQPMEKLNVRYFRKAIWIYSSGLMDPKSNQICTLSNTLWPGEQETLDAHKNTGTKWWLIQDINSLNYWAQRECSPGTAERDPTGWRDSKTL